MHEVAICQSIIRTLEMELTKAQLQSVREVHLRIGLLSGVEPMFLRHAYKFMVADSPFQNASLHIETVNVLAQCDGCEMKFTVENYRFICPKCGQPAGNVLEGNELQIHKVVYEEVEEPSREEVNE